MSMKKKWHKLGGIWKNTFTQKDGTEVSKLSIAIELAEPVTLKIQQGQRVVDVELVPNSSGRVYLQLQKPEDEIDSLLANGVIDEATAERRKAILPEELRFNVVLPPPRD